MTNVTISSNGGDGLSEAVSAGRARLVNATISGNAGYGLRGQAGTTLTNATVAWNGTVGVYVATVKNTIVVGNTGLNCSGVTSAGNNLDSGTTCNFAAPGDVRNVDPRLGPLQDNGGFTPTHALLSGSRAIDAASNADCPATDQRGVMRPQDGDGDGSFICDMGSFELPSTPTFTPTITLTPTHTSTPTATPGVCAPRPPVTVQTTRPAFGQLSVIITATTLPATPSNWLRRIRFERLDNARVTLRTSVSQEQPFVVELPDRPRQVAFSATWRAQGPYTVHLTIEDDCNSPWRTFVGAGPGAY